MAITPGFVLIDSVFGLRGGLCFIFQKNDWMNPSCLQNCSAKVIGLKNFSLPTNAVAQQMIFVRIQLFVAKMLTAINRLFEKGVSAFVLFYEKAVV